MRLPGLLLFGALLQASLAASLPARADTISFDVPNPVPLDGLTAGGVTFGYQDSLWGSAVNARAGVPWPSGFEPPGVLGGVLYADARGVLTLDFARPVDRLGFDLRSEHVPVGERGGRVRALRSRPRAELDLGRRRGAGAGRLGGLAFRVPGAPVSRLVVQIDGMALRWLLACVAPPLLVMDNLDYGVAEATGRARGASSTRRFRLPGSLAGRWLHSWH